MTKTQVNTLITNIYSNNNLLENIAISCVIFGFHEGKLKILLSKYRFCNKWILPGGFVLENEDIDTAVKRIISIKTSLDNVYTSLFDLLGDCNRTNPLEDQLVISSFEIKDPESHWFTKRSIAAGYFALTKYENVIPKADELIEELSWFNIDEIPELYGDHNEMIEKSLISIRKQIGHIPLGYELLPSKFTMPELRVLYESIVGGELDRRNFQRKMLSLGIINRLKEKRRNGAHKAPYLYSFDEDKYQKTLEKGIPFLGFYIL